MSKDSVTFWELPEFIVGVSPKSGSTSFARAFPSAVRIDPRRDGEKFREKGCIYYMRNPLSRLVSAYKGFLTVNKDTKHSPPDEALSSFEKFVDYCRVHRNHHWDPVHPFMNCITEVRDFDRFHELVGDKKSNVSGPIAVFINHETFAKIAGYWCKDFIIYASVKGNV